MGSEVLSVANPSPLSGSTPSADSPMLSMPILVTLEGAVFVRGVKYFFFSLIWARGSRWSSYRIPPGPRPRWPPPILDRLRRSDRQHVFGPPVFRKVSMDLG